MWINYIPRQLNRLGTTDVDWPTQMNFMYSDINATSMSDTVVLIQNVTRKIFTKNLKDSDLELRLIEKEWVENVVKV